MIRTSCMAFLLGSWSTWGEEEGRLLFECLDQDDLTLTHFDSWQLRLPDGSAKAPDIWMENKANLSRFQFWVALLFGRISGNMPFLAAKLSTVSNAHFEVLMSAENGTTETAQPKLLAGSAVLAAPLRSKFAFHSALAKFHSVAEQPEKMRGMIGPMEHNQDIEGANTSFRTVEAKPLQCWVPTEFYPQR